MKRIIVGVVLMACVAGVALADEVTHRQAAEEALTITQADKAVDVMFDQLMMMQRQQLQGVVDPENALALQEKIMNAYKETLSWENTKEEYIDVYVEYFTEEELRELVKFYKTEVGQKFLEKQPELMVRGMEIGQRRAQMAVPKVHAIIREEIERVEKEQEAEGLLDVPQEAPEVVEEAEEETEAMAEEAEEEENEGGDGSGEEAPAEEE